jgi:hypothetical protein
MTTLALIRHYAVRSSKSDGSVARTLVPAQQIAGDWVAALERLSGLPAPVRQTFEERPNRSFNGGSPARK